MVVSAQVVEGAIPVGAAVLTKMGIAGCSGMLETLAENSIMGVETTKEELFMSFGMSAVFLERETTFCAIIRGQGMQLTT